MSRSVGSIIAALVVGSLAVPVALAADLHLVWEDRCAECHGEAGQFARMYLGVVDGKLAGQHADRDLRSFLKNHYLKDDEVDAVYEMLFAQASTEARFKLQCAGCHEKAARLVRDSVERRDGVLYGRKTGRPLTEFLQHHWARGDAEVTFFLDLLDRIEKEVHQFRTP